ncbi:MAG: S8 family serine peptidase [Bacteroidetes bacterium]|nr:S8 family serine peptidase [Bacteroidota bacterium]
MITPSFRQFFAVIAMLFFGMQSVDAQYRPIRGERPPIDLDKVSRDAYEPNKISIKLRPDLASSIEGKHVIVAPQGFGIPALDTILSDYSLKKASQMFYSPALNFRFDDRMRAWGFHLWYELDFGDSSPDIIGLVKKLQALPETEVAEPVYKKRLIAPVADEELQEKGNAGHSGSASRWTPNDPRFNEQWHYHNTGQQGGTADKDIDLPEAWEIEKGNSNVIVAVIDGGIQFDHPDLAGNMWPGIGYNFVNSSSTIVPHNHGTHVAGTVSAVNNNGVGVAGVAGGSGSGNGVRLMSCQVFTSSSSGGFHLAPVYAANNGAAISQNSWGYTSAGVFEQSVLDAIDFFNQNGGGAAMTGGITIFAAGNDDASGQWYPGCYSGAFAVAATNNNDQKAWYSNYDTWVDISAPGGETNTVSARGVLSTITGNSYAFYQGTSMACPHASGVAALVVSLAYGQLSNADLKDILRNSTDNHYAQNPSFIGKLGTGRLNAHQALLTTQNYLTGVLNPTNFSATGVSTTQINLSWNKNTSNHDVMLVWAPTATIGTPVEGVNYTVGQTLPGGGTVLYKGGATNFSHTGLNANTQYFYKLFSYNPTFTYSSGRDANAYTLCGIFTSLPYNQDFNAAPSLPNCWTIVDHQGNGQVWQFGTITNGLTGTTGNYAYLNSDGFGSDNTQNASLISPVFDMSGYMNVNLSFKHYFRQYQIASTARLYYSIDGGTNWTEIANWTTTSSNPANFSQTIAALTGQSNVRFRWHYQGTWAYYWCVDDIVISGDINVPGAPTAAHTPVPADLFAGAGLNGSLQWTWGNNTDKYDLWFGPAGNMQKVVNQGNAGSSGSQGTYTYTGLNPTTVYQWQVVSYNTSLPMSVNSPVWNFTTACGVFGLPFSEGFEDSSPSRQCWTQEFVQGNKEWTYATGSSGGSITSAHSGVKNARFTSTSGGPFITKLVSPILDLSGLMNLRLSFWYGQEFWSPDQNELKLYYRTSPTSPWVQIGNTYNQNVAQWTQVSDIELPNPSATYQIAFEGIDNWGRANVLDDIEITGLPSGPFADFIASPLTAMVGQPITFTDASGNGSFSSWSWDFGAGASPATATGQGPHTVTYDTPGQKTISLLVDGLYSKTRTNYVTITENPYQPPQNLSAMVYGGNNVQLSWQAPTLTAHASAIDTDIQDISKIIIDSSTHETVLAVGPTLLVPQGSRVESGRAVLFNNGPFVNSPGTGPGGSDHSVLQNSSLNMSILGFGAQSSAGNRVADDFTVNAPWQVESFTFYVYQTGSSTTSTITAAYIQIWNGDPAAGGQVIWGNTTTNRMSSTSWATAYRVSQTTVDTQRPIMRVVCNTPGLNLQPGTYWVDVSFAGSLSSGPWAPPITINGQTTTGNAKQFTSDAWQNLLDSGTNTAQGIPFVIEGSAMQVTSYKIFRNNVHIGSTAPDVLTHNDTGLSPGTYDYHITAMYDANESGPSNVVQVDITTATCNAPAGLTTTNVTTNSARLSWIANPQVLSWDLKYGLTGFDPNFEGILIMGIGAVPFDLDNLQPATTYDFYVRSNCPGNAQSDWSAPATFSTLMPPPAVFDLTGGGSYCQGASPTGISATLSGSETTATYQLLRNSIPFGDPVAGTGSPLEWLNLTEGTYTLVATNSNSSMPMNGQAVVSETPAVPVSVSIQADQTSVCQGTAVNFTATAQNPGTSPVYQWTVNGSNAGTNSPNFSFVPNDGDQVQLLLISSETCAQPAVATSNTLTITVQTPAMASIIIQASQNPVCQGSTVSFSAQLFNPGSAPIIQWFVNNILLSSGTSTSFAYMPANNDVVEAVMISSLDCVSNNPATSNGVLMEVSPLLTPSVTISTASTSLCNGQQANVSATPVNGGNSPIFQWMLNGNPAGTNSPSFSFVPAHGDQLMLSMSSSLSCVSGNPATSNTLSFTVSPVTINLGVSPAGAGTATYSGTPVIGQPLSLTATPAQGFNFLNWTDGQGNVLSSLPSFSFVPGLCSHNLTANFSSGVSLLGKLAYFNPVESALPAGSNFMVQLFDGNAPVGNAQPVATTYTFGGLEAGKTYTIRLWEDHSSGQLGQTWNFNNWGGVSALDALIVSHMSTGNPVVANFPWIMPAAGQPMTAFAEFSADVNNSNTITGLDPLIIMYRTVGFPGTSPFPGNKHNFQLAGHWAANAASVCYPAAPETLLTPNGAYQASSSAQSVFYEAQLPALANGPNFFNIYLLANGDLNASYIPASLSSKEGAILSYEGSIAAAVGQTLNIPLRINQTQRLAAITLGMSYNKQLLEINGLQGFDIFFIDQQKGEVRIAWMDQQGREYGAGQQLLSLQARLLEHIVPGTRYLELLPNTEFVNINAQILNNVPLATDYIVSGTTGLNEPQNLTHKVYPNPFNNSTLLQVNLPAEGRLRVSIHNYLGQEVLRLADGYFPQGQAQFDIHQHQLPASGAYVYTVDLLTPSGWQRSKGNLILIR